MSYNRIAIAFLAPLFLPTQAAQASDRLSILDYAPAGARVDRTGHADESQALANAVVAANAKIARGEPACIYFPPGSYRIATRPPPLAGAGCVVGDGPSQSTIDMD